MPATVAEAVTVTFTQQIASRALPSVKLSLEVSLAEFFITRPFGFNSTETSGAHFPGLEGRVLGDIETQSASHAAVSTWHIHPWLAHIVWRIETPHEEIQTGPNKQPRTSMHRDTQNQVPGNTTEGQQRM